MNNRISSRSGSPVYPDSYYAATAAEAPGDPALAGDMTADVCIVGGGMTGLSAALELSLQGFSVVLLDAEAMAWGASGRAGGQLIVGYGATPQAMEQLMGREDAREAFQISVDALQLVRDRISEYRIDCDLVAGQAELAARPEHMDEFRETCELLAGEYNYSLQMLDREQLREQLDSPVYHGAWFDPRGGHLHPLNYAQGLARAAREAGAQLFSATRVLDIQQGSSPRVVTSGGRVHCRQVVVAANAYLANLLPGIEKRILPVGSYICATRPLGAQAGELIRNNMAVADSKHLTSYYRMSADGRLLFGGRTGLTQKQPANLQQVMRARIKHIFPQLPDPQFDYCWGGNIAVTMNRMPDIGRLGNNLYYAHGFSGHGILMANMAGKLMAQAIAGEAGRFDLFGRIRHRNYPGGTYLRKPGLALAMLYFALRDLTG
ncbi:NAD(P)/FAD-dependent oxidoreductase [Aliamphritea hakodatensis]|uniref:NAD(P)/FAD-dependent oxidoreductase n=1 Tax=Aliamphritea hakodatensis TaxID=2895352 RepID=UPI0022FD8590|nr:FAD-binding oxidoreductase [Aliamphritea hakodatensis]